MNPEGRYPEPASVRAAARETWEKRQRGRLSVAARVAASVPWWLVAVAADALRVWRTRTGDDELTDTENGQEQT